jgi:hypothetical protein
LDQGSAVHYRPALQKPAGQAQCGSEQKILEQLEREREREQRPSLFPELSEHTSEVKANREHHGGFVFVRIAHAGYGRR